MQVNMGGRRAEACPLHQDSFEEKCRRAARTPPILAKPAKMGEQKFCFRMQGSDTWRGVQKLKV